MLLEVKLGMRRPFVAHRVKTSFDSAGISTLCFRIAIL
jgi:hypothetical protein